MTTHARTPAARLLTALACLTALLASLMLPTAAQAVPPVPGADTQTLTFSLKMKASYKDEHTDSDNSFGVTILKGKTKINKKKVSVERISTYNYVNGAGPISGFLVLKWKGNTELAFNVAGQAEPVNGTTVISANLALFDAEGAWAGYTGFGTMTGTRTGPIGSPVTYTFTLTLQR